MKVCAKYAEVTVFSPGISVLSSFTLWLNVQEMVSPTRSSLRRQGSRKVDQPGIATSLKVSLFKLPGLDIVQSAVAILAGRGNIAKFSYRNAFNFKRSRTESGMTPFPVGLVS